jgi:uncharacterized membrane protein YeiB
MIRSATMSILSSGHGLLRIAAADRLPDSFWVGTLLLAGQMALTGSLLHSVILSVVSRGWGLGLFGQVSVAECVAISVFVYALLGAVFMA